MNGKMLELVRYRIKQSRDSLETAELLFNHERFAEAVNRAYYAMFYAVLALLALKKKETSRHQGAIALFDQEYVKSSAFPREFSRWIHCAFELRLDADYLPFAEVQEQDVKECLDNASVFVQEVARWIERLPQNAKGEEGERDEERGGEGNGEEL